MNTDELVKDTIIAMETFEAERHYETVCGWWDGHQWPRIPLASLPRTGCVATYNGLMVCAGWLYQTDSTIAWMEWMVMDPAAPREVRGEVLDAMIDALCAAAQDMGFRQIFTSINNNRLLRRLESHDFKVTDAHATNLVKVV